MYSSDIYEPGLIVRTQKDSLFPRKRHIGSYPIGQNMQNINQSTYPSSAFGLLQYYQNNQLYQIGCGVLISENKVLTFTPVFCEDDSIHEYEKMKLKQLQIKHKILKSVEQMQQYTSQLKHLEKKSKQKSVEQILQSSNLLKNKQTSSKDAVQNYKQFYGTSPKIDKQTKLTEVQLKVKFNELQFLIDYLIKQKKDIEPIIQKYQKQDTKKIVFTPVTMQKIKYQAKMIHYPEHIQSLPFELRLKIPFVSSSLAIIELNPSQISTKTLGTLGFDFNNNPFPNTMIQYMVMGLNHSKKFIQTKKNSLYYAKTFLEGSVIIYRLRDKYIISGFAHQQKEKLQQRQYYQCQPYLQAKLQKVTILDQQKYNKYQIMTYYPEKQQNYYSYLRLENINHHIIQKQIENHIQWYYLKTLILSNQNEPFSINMIKSLTKCQFVNLIVLAIKNSGLRNQHIRYLVKSNWPNLSFLNLKGNKLNFECLDILIQGNWRLFQGLDLSDNHVAADQLKILMRAEWNLLNFINLQAKGQYNSFNQLLIQKMIQSKLSLNQQHLIAL